MCFWTCESQQLKWNIKMLFHSGNSVLFLVNRAVSYRKVNATKISLLKLQNLWIIYFVLERGKKNKLCISKNWTSVPLTRSLCNMGWVFFPLSLLSFSLWWCSISYIPLNEISLLFSGGKGLNKEHGIKYLVVYVLEAYFILYTFPWALVLIPTQGF